MSLGWLALEYLLKVFLIKKLTRCRISEIWVGHGCWKCCSINSFAEDATFCSGLWKLLSCLTVSDLNTHNSDFCIWKRNKNPTSNDSENIRHLSSPVIRFWLRCHMTFLLLDIQQRVKKSQLSKKQLNMFLINIHKVKRIQSKRPVWNDVPVTALVWASLKWTAPYSSDNTILTTHAWCLWPATLP